MSKLDQIKREQRRGARRRFRFSFGELMAAFVIGAMLAAYGLLAAMLYGQCTCVSRPHPDQNVIVYLIQYGCAALGIWILVVTVMALRNRND